MEPRQNPVFMFLPSGIRLGGPGSSGGSTSAIKGILSVPAEGQCATILKENVVIPVNAVSPPPQSPAPVPKRRGRHKAQTPHPPLPTPPPPRSRVFRRPAVFRLPTEEEEEVIFKKLETEAEEDEVEDMETEEEHFATPTGRISGNFQGSGGPAVVEKKRKSETKPSDVGSIRRLYYIVDIMDVIHSGERKSSRSSSPTPCYSEISRMSPSSLETLQKHIKWIRQNIPQLFWNSLIRNYEQIKQFEKFQSTGDHFNGDWRAFSAIHYAAITTASKFMSTIGTFYDDRTSSSDSHSSSTSDDKRKGRCACIKFLQKTMSGTLLVAKEQKALPIKAIEELLDKYYELGFRASFKLIDVDVTAPSSPSNVDSSHSFSSLSKGEKEEAATNANYNSNNCSGCLELNCICTKISKHFEEGNIAIIGLGLREELAGPRLYLSMKRAMQVMLSKLSTTDNVEMSNLKDLEQWLKGRFDVWVSAIYPRLKEESVSASELQLIHEGMMKDLKAMLLEQYGKTIIKDLFSVIIEFPDSKPLLDDLKSCMKEVNLRNFLVSDLKSTLERRLLNAAVNTTEVLEAYISTVRALKYVDPSGILVQLVTPPVREYLKHREETVRVILISLTEETGELSEELTRNPVNSERTAKQTLAQYLAWEPDPIDVPKDKQNLRNSDLIEAMVSIYGSKTVFIDEYRALLADRLLRMPKPGSITREIKCLELLKLRFGESDLQKCEVMLKDVGDSQRLNTRFYEDEGAMLVEEKVQVTALVVSAQFWPSFKPEELTLPGPIDTAMKAYTKAFEMIKGNRTLEWFKHIGTVQLEIEHEGTVVSYSVAPVYATIIYHFEQKPRWTLQELSSAIGRSKAFVANRIGFWVSKGLLLNVGEETYALTDSIGSPGATSSAQATSYLEEIDNESPMTSTSSQRATELQVFWSYIEAMLTNLESLPLSRIHSMLKLFATVECSSDDLQRFLDEKVSQNLLIYSAGQYQLPK